MLFHGERVLPQHLWCERLVDVGGARSPAEISLAETFMSGIRVNEHPADVLELCEGRAPRYLHCAPRT
jgi:hypothetical protein